MHRFNFLFLVSLLFLLLLSMEHGHAQEKSIHGIVFDDSGLPLPGVTILVKNTKIGTSTDVHGKFILKNVDTDKTLVISFIGKQIIELPARPDMRIVLLSVSKQLDEAIIQVAYGASKKNAITGAIATTDSKQIDRRPVTTVAAALEGVAPGVIVNNTYAQPGDDPSIRIRGFGSVNGDNNPFYVVNGVPFSGTLSEINPMDIESISVLKDASAAALYGNKAANGVILITLKKATDKRLTIEATVRQGIYARGMKDYERIGTDDFMETMWKGYRNSLVTGGETLENANIKTNQELMSGYLKYNIYDVPADQLFDGEGRLTEGIKVREAIREDLDWIAPLERNGYRQEYSLNGGAMLEKGDYRFSLGYTNEEGYLKNAAFDRLTALLQLNLTPKKWFGCGLTLHGAHQNQNITSGQEKSFSNVFNVARFVAPIYPVHLHDLETGDYLLDAYNNKQYDNGVDLERPQYLKRNIIWENEINTNQLRKNTISGQAYADIKLPLGFTFTLKGDLYLNDQERRRFNDPLIGDYLGEGAKLHTQYRIKRHFFQQQLNWQRKFGKHSAEILLAHENYNYNYQYTTFQKSGQILPNNSSLSNFTTIKSLEGYPMNYRTEGYLGRARYQYDGKYFAECSFRSDGSSRFHPNHRWGNFGSAGVAWLASEEQFLKQINWLDRLKLRFAYGEVGNDASVGYYGWMALYTIDGNGGEAALYKSQNVAENIKWETTATYDVALEATLFKRWNLTLEYFDKQSKDLLFDVSLPLSSGAPSTDASQLATVTRNLGSVSNRGWEISTDVDLIRSGAWKWNIGVNATVIKNKILKLPPENRETGIIVAGENQKYMEGHSVYEWWLPIFAGVDQLTGNSLYLPDLEKYSIANEEEGKQPLPESDCVKIGDNYYTTNASFAQRDWCGSALPDLYGSFSTQLDWKNFSFSTLFTYSIGGKIYDKSYALLMSTGGVPTALHKDILKSWDGVPEGISEDSPLRLNPDGIPVVDNTRSLKNNDASSRFLVDASYLTLKNITASYALPRNIVNKLDLEGIHISVSMENVAFFNKRKGMNPQQSFRGLSENVLLAPKVISFGLTVKL